MNLIKFNLKNLKLPKLPKFSKKKPTADKPPKKKEKMDWVAAIAGFVSVIVIIGIIGVICMIAMFSVMLKDKPELSIDDFQSSESSIVYDRNGEVIAELGATIRENITYDDLPNNVIDAFIAVEDSRFFEHNGFDLPRFTKAILENIKSLSFSQGGSTFTMQLVKNTYFTNDSSGTTASRSGLSGVTRKVQEIALAMELENELSKEEILTLYLNKLNFGGGSQNIRGIQKASYYYFGKSVTEVNLSEAAFLAGVVNAPSAYNPYYHLEAATTRRNNVLYLMNLHGYITDTEYQIALATKLEDSLVAENSSSRGSGTATKYQAYIDEVINEVYELTGLDPYTTTMEIYTYMDQDVQTVMDNIQKGDIDAYEFPDDNFELASIATNIQTGEIVGILGGRNYSSGGALLLNHATEQYKQPGSSIKPILDYVLAFEYLGWATDHVLVDKPINYAGTDIVIGNSDGKYRGQVTIQDCIGYSLNTTAIQTLQQVVNKVGIAKVIEYMNAIGFDQAENEDFNVQWGIGGGEFYVSCKQMASAMGTIINYGTYYEPHTIKKIVFANGKEPVEPVYVGSNPISAEASYLMSEILYGNVNNGYANLMNIIKEEEYAVYGKTGTTDWGDSGREYGIPDGAIKDGWCVAGTSDFCVATWVGYEKAIKDEPSYMTLEQYLKCIKEKTTNLILDETVNSFGKPDEKMTKPEGVTDITHIIAVYPYVSPIEGMSEQYITTGQIITKYAELGSPESVSIESISDNCSIAVSDKYTLTLTWPKYPNESQLSVASETMDLTLEDEEEEIYKEAEGTRLFDYSWVYGAVKYKANITVNGKSKGTVVSGSETYSTKDFNLGAGDKVEVEFYYGYENKGINSNSVKKTHNIEDTSRDYSIKSISSYSELVKWATDNGFKEKNISKVEFDENNPGGHTDGQIVITLDDTNVSIVNDKFSMKDSQKKNAIITYYVKKVVDPKLSLMSIGDSNKVTLNSSGDVTAELSFIISDVNNETLYLSFSPSTGISWNSADLVTTVQGETTKITITFADNVEPGDYEVTMKLMKGSTEVKTSSLPFKVLAAETNNPGEGEDPPGDGD